MTTTKEGGGRGESERERERGSEESQNTFLLESSKLMRKKRRERGWRCQWCCECSPPSLEERGSERRETGLGCSRSRKSPRKMNLLISLVLVHEKSFYRREEQKKTKKREGNFWLTNKQKRRTNKKERPKRETDQTLSFLLLRNTHYYY